MRERTSPLEARVGTASDRRITVNKNAIPFDQNPPNIASGLRIGTPETTSRGFGPDEMRALGRMSVEAIAARDEPAEQARFAAQVHDICGRFPVPGLPDAGLLDE